MYQEGLAFMNHEVDSRKIHANLFYFSNLLFRTDDEIFQEEDSFARNQFSPDFFARNQFYNENNLCHEPNIF